MAISRDLPPLVHGRAIGWKNYVAIQNQPASRLMTDYSWRAGSQADETAVVLKNCVGNACLLTQARLLGHMPPLTMARNKHFRPYPAIHRHQFRSPGMARDRSEERRVGQGCVSTFRSRWSAFHKQNKTT